MTMRLCGACVIAIVLAACGGDDGASLGEPTCEAVVDNEIAHCPDNEPDRDRAVRACQGNYDMFALVGCSAPFEGWLACNSGGVYDCEEGVTTCEDARLAYFRCSSQFTQRTGCSAIEANHPNCTTELPNAFGCIAATPPTTACIPMPNNTGGANLYCCP